MKFALLFATLLLSACAGAPSGSAYSGGADGLAPAPDGRPRLTPAFLASRGLSPRTSSLAIALQPGVPYLGCVVQEATAFGDSAPPCQPSIALLFDRPSRMAAVMQP